MIFLASFIEAWKHVVLCPGTMLLANVSYMEATLYRLATNLVPKLKILLLMSFTFWLTHFDPGLSRLNRNKGGGDYLGEANDAAHKLDHIYYVNAF